MVYADWLKVGKHWTRILVCGDLWPRYPARRQDRLMIIIPGNPGVVDFYEDFAIQLHASLNAKVQKDKKVQGIMPATSSSTEIAQLNSRDRMKQSGTVWSVWVLSHAGHVDYPTELVSYAETSPPLVTDQLMHHQQLLSDLFPWGSENIPSQLHVAGHSIGAYFALKLLPHLRLLSTNKEGSTVSLIKQIFLLFPTFELMADSPNGKWFQFCRNWGIHWVMRVFSKISSCLVSLGIVDLVVRLAYGSRLGDGIRRGIYTVISSRVTNNVLNMAANEMDTIVRLPSDIRDEFTNRPDGIKAIYSPSDGWAPPEYAARLQTEFPRLSVQTLPDVSHAFVMDPLEIADVVEAIVDAIE